MDATKIKAARTRLSGEYENLVKSVKRSQIAADEIRIEHTEDEGDLATISHDRDVLYNLHEGSFVRLQSIEAAIKAIDSGQYGVCIRCEEDISEKRLEAVPWASMCIRCQEASEADHSSSRMVLTGPEEEADL